jgi:hypothetical protein
MLLLMLHDHAHAACPIVHAACPQNATLWVAKFVEFCNGNTSETPHYAVASLIAKIMEVMVSLLKDTGAKAYRSSDGRMRPCW